MDDGEGGYENMDITGMNDKRQITVVFSITKAGNYLPPQLIMQGKHPRPSTFLLAGV